MVIHKFLLRGSHPHLGKGKVIMAIGILTLLGREEVVVMVMHLFLRSMSSCFLGKGRGGGTSHPFAVWQMNAMLQVGNYSHWNARVWPTTSQREQQAPKHRSSFPLLIQDHQDQEQDHQGQDQDHRDQDQDHQDQEPDHQDQGQDHDNNITRSLNSGVCLLTSNSWLSYHGQHQAKIRTDITRVRTRITRVRPRITRIRAKITKIRTRSASSLF